MEEKKQVKKVTRTRKTNADKNPYNLREEIGRTLRDMYPTYVKMMKQAAKDNDVITFQKMWEFLSKKGLPDLKPVDELGTSDNKLEVIIKNESTGDKDKAYRKPVLTEEEKEEQNAVNDFITSLTLETEGDIQEQSTD